MQLPLEGGGEPLPKTAVPTNTLLLGSCVSHAKCARSAASALNAVLAWLGGAGAGAWCWCWCRLHACLGAAQPRGRSLLATQGLDAELPHRAHGALPLPRHAAHYISLPGSCKSKPIWSGLPLQTLYETAQQHKMWRLTQCHKHPSNILSKSVTTHVKCRALGDSRAPASTQNRCTCGAPSATRHRCIRTCRRPRQHSRAS